MKPIQLQKYMSAAAILMTLSACGSHQAKDTPEGEEGAPPSLDAGTDAVPPQPTAELPPAATPPAASPDTSAQTPSPEQTPSTEQSAAPATTVSDSGSSDSYTVKRGDTLMKIAF